MMNLVVFNLSEFFFVRLEGRLIYLYFLLLVRCFVRINDKVATKLTERVHLTIKIRKFIDKLFAYVSF